MRSFLSRSRPGLFAPVALFCVLALGAGQGHSKRPPATSEAGPTELVYVGYLPDHEHPKVHVRTGERTPVRLERLSADHWALHLPHAEIVRHVMTLALDMSCFSEAVERIVPEPQEEPQRGSVVHLFLRTPSMLSLHQRSADVFVHVYPKAKR